MKLDRALCREYLNMPDTHWDAAQSVLDGIMKENFGKGLLNLIQQSFFVNHSPENAARQMKKLAQHLYHQDSGTVYAAVFGACLPRLVEALRQICADELFLRETLLDYSIWAEEYEAETGNQGVGEYAWLTILFCQKIFRLGRLQFEPYVFKHPYWIYEDPATGIRQVLNAPSEDTSLRLLLKPGTQVLNLHIPKSGQLTPNLVEDSLHRAEVFFREQNLPYEAIICESWLMDPQVQKFAAMSENICAFQKRFLVYPLEKNCSEAQYRIFGRNDADTKPELLPEATRLQKSFKQFRLQGGQPRDMGGVIFKGSVRK